VGQGINRSPSERHEASGHYKSHFTQVFFFPASAAKSQQKKLQTHGNGLSGPSKKKHVAASFGCLLSVSNLSECGLVSKAYMPRKPPSRQPKRQQRR
jgi:hypothetical protein